MGWEEIASLASTLLGVVVALAVAWFVSMWVHRAKGSRANTMGLYLTFGGFGFFIFLLGVGSAWRSWREGVTPGDRSLLFVLIGVVAGLTLIPHLRRLLAKVIPFDPESWPDTIGLFLLGTLSVVSVFALFIEDEELEPVDAVQLVVTPIFYVALALIAVGYGIHRSLPEALQRLGLERPTGRQVGLALLFVFAALVVSGVSGWLVQVLQPDLAKEIEDNLRTMTENVDSIWGALFLGISAGVGEEVLFRGAIQPRYGIVFTSLVFALLHQQYGASVITAGVFFAALLFGIERKYLNTTACIITHAAYNTLAVLATQVDVPEEQARGALHILAHLF